MILLILLSALPSFSVRLVSVSPVVVERWDDTPIPYYLQLVGSDDVGAGALTAVRAAFATWAAVDCADLTFQEFGDAPDPTTNIGAGGRPNGKNEVHWVEDDSWRFGAYVLGVTAPIIAPDGRLLEADIAFNGLQVQWTVSGNGGSDLQSVALHEIGHFIGLQHNLGPFFHDDQPVMAPYIAGGIVGRTLTADDRQAACFLYPREPYTCVDDLDCPLLLSQTFESDDFYSGRLRCDEGACSRLERYVPAAVGRGERCHRPEECRPGLSCHPYADGGVCTHACDPRADACEEGLRCEAFPVPFDREGVCLPTTGVVHAPGEGPEGCLDSWVCSDGRFCMPTPLDSTLKRCAALCTVNDPTCPQGTACHVYAGAGGACFPEDLLPEPPEPDPEPTPEAEAEPAPEVEIEAEPVETSSEPDPDPPSGSDRDSGCTGGVSGFWPLMTLVVVARRRRHHGHSGPHLS